MKVVFPKRAEHSREVKQAVEKKKVVDCMEGCTYKELLGIFTFRRRSGGIYEDAQHAFGEAMNKINISHTITHLSFGAGYPGLVNPLDGVTRSGSDDEFHYDGSGKNSMSSDRKRIEKEKEEGEKGKKKDKCEEIG